MAVLLRNGHFVVKNDQYEYCITGSVSSTNIGNILVQCSSLVALHFFPITKTLKYGLFSEDSTLCKLEKLIITEGHNRF